MTGSVRQMLAVLDPALPMADATTLDAIVGDSLGRERLSLTLILAFALGSLVLASLGIYGVVTNGVVRRTHEIGMRMALGADRNRVVGMVIAQGIRLAILGVGVGLLGAFASAGVLGSVVLGADEGHPAVYALVASVLLGLAAFASYLPARRATRIDPVEALRPE